MSQAQVQSSTATPLTHCTNAVASEMTTDGSGYPAMAPVAATA